MYKKQIRGASGFTTASRDVLCSSCAYVAPSGGRGTSCIQALPGLLFVLALLFASSFSTCKLDDSDKDSNVRIRTPTFVHTIRHVLSRLNVIERTAGRSFSDRTLHDELLLDDGLLDIPVLGPAVTSAVMFDLSLVSGCDGIDPLSSDVCLFTFAVGMSSAAFIGTERSLSLLTT